MACSGCGKRHRQSTDTDVMGGYKYLNNRQIKARLEVYKKKYCRNCAKAAECDYSVYIKCKKSNGNDYE